MELMPKHKLRNAKALLLSAAIAVACTQVNTIANARSAGQSGYNKPKPQSERPPDQEMSKDGALKLNATVINIPVVVADRSGRFIPKLTKEDFEVFEDGTRQEVAFLGNEEVSFNVALLMDMSQSVSNSLKDIKNAANEFVRQLRPNDKVMVVAFDQQVSYLTDFTNDRKRLESAINSCQTGRGTSVYEAVYDTVASRFRNIEGRKAMLLLSDGEDTTSKRVSYDETIERVAESDVLVYGLRYPDTGGRGGWRQQRNSPFPFPGRRWPFNQKTGTGLNEKAAGGSAAQGSGCAPDKLLWRLREKDINDILVLIQY